MARIPGATVASKSTNGLKAACSEVIEVAEDYRSNYNSIRDVMLKTEAMTMETRRGREILRCRQDLQFLSDVYLLN